MLFNTRMWIVSMLVVIIVAVAVSFATRDVRPSANGGRRATPSVTSGQHSGQRWFWNRSQWIGPESQQP
ncbi:MAG: hypothetical protein NVS4B8_12530 [Herpetosiphon sp.]